MSNLSNHPLFAELETRKNINAKVNTLAIKIASAAKLRAPWNVFGYKSGKLMGILLTLLRNPQLREEQVPEELVELYGETCGNLPFIGNDGRVYHGTPQNCAKLKLVMDYFIKLLEIPVPEDYLDDINQETWDRLFTQAEERVRENSSSDSKGFVKPETTQKKDEDEEEEEEKKPQLSVKLEKAPWD